MSTAVIILIALGAVAILAAIYMASRKQTMQRREDERLIATEHRQEAERTRLDAEKQEAIAEEEAAAAKRQAAEAEQRAHSAQLAQLEADAHADHAREIDPDVSNEPHVHDDNEPHVRDESVDERHEVFDEERERPGTGEPPPADETESAQRQA